MPPCITLHMSPHELVAVWKRQLLKTSYKLSRSKTGYSMSSLPIPTPQIHHNTLLKLADAATDTRTAGVTLIEMSLFPPVDIAMLLLESLY